MPYPIDEEKLQRVRDALNEQEIDALVVRAPDNVLYLTNYWPMKGYAAAVFPREGEPVLIVIEPQLKDAQHMGWSKDIRTFKGYDSKDPRPPTARSLDVCLEVLREKDWTGKVGVELSQGSQICDRMVGEPTVYTQAYFDAQKLESFYPFVQLVFEVKNAEQHYHVPLLLSPFGYSTYRGS